MYVCKQIGMPTGRHWSTQCLWSRDLLSSHTVPTPCWPLGREPEMDERPALEGLSFFSSSLRSPPTFTSHVRLILWLIFCYDFTHYSFLLKNLAVAFFFYRNCPNSLVWHWRLRIQCQPLKFLLKRFSSNIPSFWS